MPLVQCDLSSLASVRAATEKIAKNTATIDYFIANAGVVRPPLPPLGESHCHYGER